MRYPTNDQCSREPDCACHSCRVGFAAWVLIAAVGVLVLLGALASLMPGRARGAEPAAAESPTARRMVGDWEIWWGGTAWETGLKTNGDYYAHRQGRSVYVGSWSVKGDVVTIVEARLEDDGTRGAWTKYVITLEKGKWEGQSEGGTRFRFVPIVGKKL